MYCTLVFQYAEEESEKEILTHSGIKNDDGNSREQERFSKQGNE